MFAGCLYHGEQNKDYANKVKNKTLVHPSLLRSLPEWFARRLALLRRLYADTRNPEPMERPIRLVYLGGTSFVRRFGLEWGHQSRCLFYRLSPGGRLFAWGELLNEAFAFALWICLGWVVLTVVVLFVFSLFAPLIRLLFFGLALALVGVLAYLSIRVLRALR